MKLITSIAPRRSGVVLAQGLDASVVWEFRPDSGGELSCDVTDAADVAALLATGNFYPANVADYDEAMALQSAAGGGDADDDDIEDDDDAVIETAMPLEAMTPVAPARRRTARKSAA
jgi:hypothetical protein